METVCVSFLGKVMVFIITLLTLELMGNNSPTLPINTCTPIYLTVVLALRLMSSMCITERANQKKKKWLKAQAITYSLITLTFTVLKQNWSKILNHLLNSMCAVRSGLVWPLFTPFVGVTQQVGNCVKKTWLKLSWMKLELSKSWQTKVVMSVICWNQQKVIFCAKRFEGRFLFLF